MATRMALHTQAHGLWDWLQRFPVPARMLSRCAKLACAMAWDEWARGYGPGATVGKLKDRFKESAWDKYDFISRSNNYNKWQMRVFGTTLPYRSPKKQVHMADIIAVPNVGFRVRTTATKGGVVARITFPGARRLNIVKGPTAKLYRKEFLRLQESAEGPCIVHRSLTLLWSLLRAQMRGKEDASV